MSPLLRIITLVVYIKFHCYLLLLINSVIITFYYVFDSEQLADVEICSMVYGRLVSIHMGYRGP